MNKFRITRSVGDDGDRWVHFDVLGYSENSRVNLVYIQRLGNNLVITLPERYVNEYFKNLDGTELDIMSKLKHKIEKEQMQDESLKKQIEDAGSEAGPRAKAPEFHPLQEAEKLIYGQRQTDYGNAKDNCTTIAQHWSAVLGCPVTVEQVIQCMICVKVARLKVTPDHKDSWIDIAGYVGVMGKCVNGE